MAAGLILFLVSALPGLPSAGDEGSETSVHCINVGQGDATLLEFPCGAILIDTGAQDAAFVGGLLDYLRHFFARRTDLNDTLESVYITHDHPDHTLGLEEVLKEFRVKRLIHNGKSKPKGTGELCRVLKHKKDYLLEVEAVTYENVVSRGRSGVSDPMIDPVACAACDPKISVLSGGFVKSPGWSVKRYGNKNNHCLVIKVEYGKAAFLFTGDLEEDAIEKLLELYRPEGRATASPLGAAVLRVGHHGSHNATTADLLIEVSPEIALISVGAWTFGQRSGNPFTTYAYGHPRKDSLELLSLAIEGFRDDPVTVYAGLGARAFSRTIVRKEIFATAWDGTVRVHATSDGSYRVESND